MSSRNLETHGEVFERTRPRLRGVAYRMLGSLADAEDAVQDVFVKWSAVSLDQIDNAEAWLVTACTNRCIDILRAAHKTRVDYTGAWLPEPIVGADGHDLDEQVELSSSLTMAFLMLMDSLGPVERAAYLLREVFSYSYKDVAFALDRTEASCRQLVRRAKQHLEQRKNPAPPAPQTHHALAQEFIGALQSGDLETFVKLLAEDVRFTSDGGGKASAVSKVIEGVEEVAKVVEAIWQAYWSGSDIRWVRVNGNPGFVVRGDSLTIVSLGVDEDGKFFRIDAVRNPDKLRHIPL